ncbi:hypothetical protein [Ferribacterium limneticum]|uniref:hypothetical protein n=1 Tax=Ferribacterium limneticum TaxID=76259 RepID=UPI001CFA9F98|nr:hypothetical protein [Ferribacterium limneticum]UCV20810.1 hypothetical protein KI610_09685 [Ferribacterium limneticum]
MRLLLIPPLLLIASPSWADPCDELPKPSVTIKRIDERLSYNTEYSYKSLTNIGASLARPGKQVLGLTRGNATVSFASNTPGIIDPTGRWECTSPQITLSFGFSPMTVYVAREFPEGTCAYKEIHEHEMRHVEAYRTHIASIEKELTETLNARFVTGAVWRGPVGQTASRLRQELDARWAPYVQRQIKRVDEAQAKIDTAEEYERVANACDGEIRKVLRGKS